MQKYTFLSLCARKLNSKTRQRRRRTCVKCALKGGVASERW